MAVAMVTRLASHAASWQTCNRIPTSGFCPQIQAAQDKDIHTLSVLYIPGPYWAQSFLVPGQSSYSNSRLSSSLNASSLPCPSFREK